MSLPTDRTALIFLPEQIQFPGEGPLHQLSDLGLRLRKPDPTRINMFTLYQGYDDNCTAWIEANSTTPSWTFSMSGANQLIICEGHNAIAVNQNGCTYIGSLFNESVEYPEQSILTIILRKDSEDDSTLVACWEWKNEVEHGNDYAALVAWAELQDCLHLLQETPNDESLHAQMQLRIDELNQALGIPIRFVQGDQHSSYSLSVAIIETALKQYLPEDLHHLMCCENPEQWSAHTEELRKKVWSHHVKIYLTIQEVGPNTRLQVRVWYAKNPFNKKREFRHLNFLEELLDSVPTEILDCDGTEEVEIFLHPEGLPITKYVGTLIQTANRFVEFEECNRPHIDRGAYWLVDMVQRGWVTAELGTKEMRN